MTDIATLGLEIRSDGVVVASDRLKKLTQDGRNAEQATSKLSTATAQLTNYLKAAAAALGLYKLAERAKESALLAARYQTLGVVMNTVGATAGYTNAQMAGFEKTLKKQGIAMVESRQALTMMAQAHLDLAKAAELGRVAQDAATIGGINSSEAFERMIAGIQKGETEILKTIGINVNFEQSYAKMALTLGKSRQELTETEKAQARMNIVLERGKDIAGVYDAAMGTAGKQLTSMKRYMDNLKVSIGSVFNDVLIAGVQAFTGALKGANAEADRLTQQNKLAEWGQGIVNVLAVIADAITIVGKGLYSMVSVGVAGFSQLYHAAESFSFAMIADFDGARNSFNEMLNDGKAWTALMNDTWSNPTMFQDAAKAMYAQRDANKEVEELKRKQLEQQQMINGESERERQAIEQKAMLQQKTAAATQDQAEVQKEVNQLVQQENELKNRNLLITDQFGILQQQIDIKKIQGLEQQAFEDQKILDLQKLKFDYSQKMLEYQEQLNTATSEEGDIIKRNMGLYQQKTEQAQLAIDSRQYQAAAIATSSSASSTGYGSSWGYDSNGNLLNPSQRMPSSATGGVTLSPVSAYAGMEHINEAGDISGIYGVINDRIDQANTQAAWSWFISSRAEQIKKEQEAAEVAREYAEAVGKATKSLNDDLYVRELEVMGLTDEAALAKIRISQQNELNKAVEDGVNTTRLLQVQQMEYNKVVKDILIKTLQAAADAALAIFNDTKSRLDQGLQDFSESINGALTTVNDTIKALTSAANGLRETANRLLGSADTTLSPEQLYLKAQSEYNATKSLAMTGDIPALQRLGSSAETYISASRGYYGSNTSFASNFSSVQSDLNSAAAFADSIGATLQPQADLLSQQIEILNAIRDAIKIDSVDQFKLQVQKLAENKAAVDANATAIVNGGNANSAGALTALSTVKSAVDSNATTVTGGVSGSISGQTTTLNGTLGGVNQSLGTVNTTTGAVTSAVNANATTVTGGVVSSISGQTATLNTATTDQTSSLASWLSAVNVSASGTTGAVNTSKDSLASWLSTVNSSTVGTTNALGTTNSALTYNGLYSLFGQYQSTYTSKQDAANAVLSATNTNTGNTAYALTNGTTAAKLSSIDSKSGKIKYSSNDEWVYAYNPATGKTEFYKAGSSTSRYEYYANGGIANKPSIFGEAGPEAAVPLPDGRTIPVTITGAADNRDVVDELQQLRAEFADLKSTMRRVVAGR